MFAIADTRTLVADRVITGAQAAEIEARARSAMMTLAINTILCVGILAATSGLVFWLANAVAVAVFGALALAVGVWILSRGSDIYGMFGNAAAIIGAGMLIGGATIELLASYQDAAGQVLAIGGLVVMGVTGAVLWRGLRGALFVTGAIGLAGLSMHLGGLMLILEQAGTTGPGKSLFFFYAAGLIAVAGWAVDVRLVTALAIVPFAQMLDTGTGYFHAAYVFYSPESTLSILQMAALIALCLLVSRQVAERTGRHAGVLAVLAFVVANLCALVGSLWGDVVGATVWGPGSYSDSDFADYDSWIAASEAFEGAAVVIGAFVYSILWAAALVAVIFWAAHRHQRGLLNAGLTFGAIHAYTQFFESFADQPMAYAIGGLAAIPVAWGMWRLNRWMTEQEATGD